MQSHSFNTKKSEKLTDKSERPQHGDDDEDVGVGEGVIGVRVGHGPPAVDGDHGDGERGHEDVGS